MRRRRQATETRRQNLAGKKPCERADTLPKLAIRRIFKKGVGDDIDAQETSQLSDGGMRMLQQCLHVMVRNILKHLLQLNYMAVYQQGGPVPAGVSAFYQAIGVAPKRGFKTVSNRALQAVLP